MDVNDLKSYVNAKDDDTEFVTLCWTEALVLVDDFCGESEIPTVIKDRAVLEVAAELFNRRGNKGGAQQFADLSGPAIRILRDPMAVAYPILGKYVVML